MSWCQRVGSVSRVNLKTYPYSHDIAVDRSIEAVAHVGREGLLNVRPLTSMSNTLHNTYHRPIIVKFSIRICHAESTIRRLAPWIVALKSIAVIVEAGLDARRSGVHWSIRIVSNTVVLCDLDAFFGEVASIP